MAQTGKTGYLAYETTKDIPIMYLGDLGRRIKEGSNIRILKIDNNVAVPYGIVSVTRVPFLEQSEDYANQNDVYGIDMKHLIKFFRGVQ